MEEAVASPEILAGLGRQDGSEVRASIAPDQDHLKSSMTASATASLQVLPRNYGQYRSKAWTSLTKRDDHPKCHASSSRPRTLPHSPWAMPSHPSILRCFPPWIAPKLNLTVVRTHATIPDVYGKGATVMIISCSSTIDDENRRLLRSALELILESQKANFRESVARLRDFAEYMQKCKQA